MTLIPLLLVAVALGTDAMSVAIGIGMSGIKRRDILLLSAVVSLFHVLMPLIGLYLGLILGSIVGQYAAVVGAGILVLIGVQMVWTHLPERNTRVISWSDWRRGSVPPSPSEVYVPTVSGVVMLAGGVSLDALSVGFGLGAIKVNLLLAVVTMGLVAGVMTAAGLVFGRRLGRWLGEKAGVVGGLMLVLIGVRMIVL